MSIMILVWAGICCSAMGTASFANSGDSAVVCFGRVMPGDRMVSVAVPYFDGAPQIVAKLLVLEGDRVKAGEVLAITHQRARAETGLARARATLAVKQAQLARTKAGEEAEMISAHESMAKSIAAEGEEAEKRLTRLEELRTEKAAPEQDWDEARARALSLRAKLSMTQQEIAAMRSVRVEDVAVAECEVAEVDAAVKQAEALLATTEVLAPCDGMVTEILAYQGEAVEREGLLRIGAVEAMTLKAEVDVSQVQLVVVGAKVRAESEAWAGEIMGLVQRISPRVDRSFLSPPSPLSSVDRRIVEVTISLHDSAPLARLSGAEATIYIEPKR